MNLLYALFLLIPYFTDSALYDRNDNLHSKNLGAKSNFKSFSVKRDHSSDSAQYSSKRRGIASSKQCGKWKAISGLFFEKIGWSENAWPHSYPFQVGIYVHERNVYGQKQLQCGGSIIGDHFVLTAAQCVEHVRKIYVKVGDHGLEHEDWHEKFYDVDWYKAHPEYTKTPKLHNDLALLHTKQRISFNVHVHPICLGRKPPFSYDTRTVVVIGWGKLNEKGPLANLLQQARVKLRVSWCSYTRTPERFCADFEDGATDSCVGDTGGPLFIMDNRKYVLLGVASWGVGYVWPGLPAIYTNVSHHIDWIESETNGHE